MVDPISWTLVGGAAITEGVKFLYGQAAELIKRRLGDKTDRALAPVAPPSGIFVEDPRLDVVDDVQLAKLERSLREALLGLSDYADGLLPIDGGDPVMIDRLTTLRDLLEKLYEQPLTFIGEDRPVATHLRSKFSIDTVAGKATGMRIGEAFGMSATAEGRIGSVAPGGEFVGLEIDKAGK